jgi:predicted transcriptional regulator of viral defense system
MGDIVDNRPSIARLFEVASTQMGYFTAAQAVAAGLSRRQLNYHAGQGTIRRVRRGLYRLRDYPSSFHEEVMEAWLALGKDTSVVSHESALDLLELSDVIPNAVHLTVPRTKRHLPRLAGVTIHTTSRPIGPGDVVVRDGIRLTSPTRTILDAAQWGTGPEQIEMAVHQALARAMADRERLVTQAQAYDTRVRRLIETSVRRTER